MDKEELCKKADKLINKNILKGKRFVEDVCFPYGEVSALQHGIIDSGFIDDFQFFVFTKSTKSLISIRELIKIGNFEDVFIILRTMYESYLESRYIKEKYNENLLDELLFIPEQIAMKKIKYDYSKRKYKEVETGDFIEYIMKNPSAFKLGGDKKYYSEFYKFLCNFSHCNYSTKMCYTNKYLLFSYNEKLYQYQARVLVLFVYNKIVESIATVEGEDFPSNSIEKSYYELVKMNITFLDEQFENLIKMFESIHEPLDDFDKDKIKMYKGMRESLKENIGSVDKSFLIK